MIKILYLIHKIALGGTEGQVLTLINKLDSSNFKAHIFVLNKTDTDYKFFENKEIQELHFSGFRTLDFLNFVKGLVHICDKLNIDIVQTHFFAENLVGLVLKKLRPKTRFVMAKRNLMVKDLPKHLYLCEKYCLGQADALVANSMSVKDRWKNLFKLKNGGIQVLYNGVDTKKYYPSTESQKAMAKLEFGLNGNDFVVGAVANWREEKNPLCLLKAAKICFNYNKAIKFVIVGDGLLIHEMNEFVKVNRLSNVFFVGTISNPVRVMHAFDVGVSTSFAEGFSNVILEFMSSGLPVVATNVGGNPEAVKHCETGYVIPSNDHQGLASYIIQLKGDNNVYRNMSRSALERVRMNFTVEKMVREYQEFYKSLVMEKGGLSK